MSDGGPCFRQEFVRIMGEMGIEAVKSSCYNPESNGQAERGVRSLKEQLKKGGRINSLQLAELAFAIHCRNQGN